LEKLIKIFTDENEVVIDPVAGSGSTLVASLNTNRRCYGFEIKKNFYKEAKEWIEDTMNDIRDLKEHGFKKTTMKKKENILF